MRISIIDFDSVRKIAPEYQQMAFDACIAAVVAEMSKGNG